LKRVIGIPFGSCFLESLSSLLMGPYDNPIEFAKTLVILPTKRSLLHLQKSLQEKTNGRVMMLPRMIALADIESENPLFLDSINNLPPSISSWKRLGMLTQLILKFQPSYTPSRALKAAKELMHFIDEAETSDIDLANLKDLAVGDYAEHWQETLGFLKIVTDHWPAILKDLRVIESQGRVRHALKAVAKHWQMNPPEHPVIIAGTTGTVPATRELIKTVLSLPKGQLILPGLDGYSRDLPLTHPKHTLSDLLDFLQVDAEDIHVMLNEKGGARNHLLQTAMDDKGIDLDKSFDPKVWPEMVECNSVTMEAKVIALMMRYYLEETTGTISLVSPNQSLCKLVETELQRWDLVANTSSGQALSSSLVGGFIVSVAELFSKPTISQLLIVLKHPLCFKSNRAKREKHLENVRILEKNILRQGRVEIGVLGPLINQKSPALSEWFKEIFKIINPIFVYLLSKKDGLFQDLLSLHLETCLLLTGDTSEKSPLWQQIDGAGARLFFETLLEEGYLFPILPFRAYPSFFQALMAQASPLRNYEGLGSRLTILGALEARLSHAEVIILGGLNEDSWPPSIDPDPWLNRSMRQQLGLPALERRIGLSAHDFSSCFYAPHLLLTRSRSDWGAPTIPSRWWQRLQVVFQKNKNSLAAAPVKPWLDWVQSFTPKSESSVHKPPKPCPPTGARPTQFSVTEIETLMRDPYGLYAKRCLDLFPLLPLDPELSSMDKGKIIHKILELYFLEDDQTLESLLKIAKPYFDQTPVMRLFWWQRFQQIAEWFVAKLKESPAQSYLTEKKGQITLSSFSLKAIADRLDLLEDNALRIIDYKTGSMPNVSDLKNGYSPQLALEALIADQGGFGVKVSPKEASIWQLKGGEGAGEIRTLEITSEFLSQTDNGLLRLLMTFMDANTPYLACPRPEKAPLFNLYTHLERLSEWQK